MGYVDNYHAKVKEHLGKCDIVSVEEAFEELQAEFEAAGKFFGFDPFFFSYESTPMEQFFEDVLKLFSTYDEAMIAIKRAAHMAELKAQRAAKRAAKAKEAAARGETFEKLDDKMGNATKQHQRRKMPKPESFEDEMQAMLKKRREKLGLKAVR